MKITWNSFLLTLDLIMVCYATETIEVVPPLIEVEVNSTVVFKPGEDFELPCLASGEPKPSYFWTKNGIKLSTSEMGTLSLPNPTVSDEGVYQCFAENSGGVAMSGEKHVKSGYLELFRPFRTPTHYPLLGTPVTLNCDVPGSLPRPVVYWALTIPGTTHLEKINYTMRISQDPKGKLHFSHAMQRDYQNNRDYVCVVYNPLVGEMISGFNQKINPQGRLADTQKYPPSTLYLPPRVQVALRGDDLRVKCIYAGNPTPRISWSRKFKDMPMTKREESFGQELVIENIQREDEGEYECLAYNDMVLNPMRYSFVVKVEERPTWTQKPQSIIIGKKQNARFECKARGKPAPNYRWYINGRLQQDISDGKTMQLNEKALVMVGLSVGYSAVVQCNATNVHGSIVANAYVVVSENSQSAETGSSSSKGTALGVSSLWPCLLMLLAIKIGGTLVLKPGFA